MATWSLVRLVKAHIHTLALISHLVKAHVHTLAHISHLVKAHIHTLAHISQYAYHLFSSTKLKITGEKTRKPL